MNLHFDENDELSLKRFERMLKTNNIFFFDSAEFERIIGFYIDNGKLNMAKKAIELALNQHPNIVGIRILKAEILIIEGKLEEAMQLLEELELLEPDNEEIYIQKALLLSKQDLHQEAIQLLEFSLEISEEIDNTDILSLIGMEYLYLEDFKKALDYFIQCLAFEPQDQTNLYHIIYCYDMLDKNEEAITFLNQYIDKEPFSEIAWHQLGKEYFVLENFSKAIEAFDYAILIDEKFVGAYLEKAKVLEEIGHYQEAVYNYHLTTTLEDPNAYVYMRMGSCYEKLDNTEKAIEFYKKSSEQDPYLDKPLLNIVSLLFDKKNYDKALFFINQLINLDDEKSLYWNLYAHANMKIAFFKEAVKAYQKCLTLKDNLLENYLGLADCHYYIGDLKEAIKTLIQAEVYYHNHPDIIYRLSGLYFLLNNNELGIKFLYNTLNTDFQKYKDFQKLFPTVYNSKMIRDILDSFNF